MAYFPNPTDATQPTDNVDASTAANEFRTLKAYIQGLVLAAGMFSAVRQCANDGFVNATGDPAFMIAAAAGGQALDLKATGRPLVVNFAGGSTGTGINDRNSTLTGDTANIITALPPSNTSYIYADYVNAASWTWGQTLAPVQYGKVYPQTIGSVLQFAGAAGSTTFLDDFGNTWAAQGNAKVQTNQIKFGTGALGGGGALNVLNGTTDYVKSVSFTTLGTDGWALRAWVYPTANPGAGFVGDIMAAVNAGGFGARVGIFNNAGTIRYYYDLSSTGAAHDIANAVVGTTVPTLNAWSFIELTFDSLANVYRLYVNGVQENSTASPSRVGLITGLLCGSNGLANSFLTGYIDKPEFLSYCQHPAGTAYAVPTAAPSLANAGYAPDAFDIQAMKMYSVTGPSVAAGAAPVTTQKYRCYLGEVDTGVAVPATIRNYAFNGTAEIAITGMPIVITIVSHNLGVMPKRTRFVIVNRVLDNISNPGNEVDTITQINPTAMAGVTLVSSKNKTVILLSNISYNVVITSGATAGIAYTNYNMKLYTSRGWGGA